MRITNLWTQLSKDYISFYENGKEHADIIIRVGKEENVKEFYVHSVVLLVRSTYFRKEVEGTKDKNDDGKIVIEKPDVNPQLFESILKYFYGGNMMFDESKFKDIYDLLLISEEFHIVELLELLESQLLRSPNQIYQNFSTILKLSHKTFKKLHKFCLNTIQERPEIIFKSQDFHLLNENTLLLLLQNKELNIKEIEKWESIIKWGIANTSSTNTSSTSLEPSTENFNEIPDVSLWTKSKFRDLANTLQQFIPLIDFYKINPEDFYEKIKPFKKIISKPLYEEILKYYILQPSASTSASDKSEPIIHIKFNSTLIELDHFQLITKWINETYTTLNNDNYYGYSLLLRGSLDGFTAKKFHELCDNKGATLTIIKIRDSAEIIGGYNPNCWDKSLYPLGQYSTVVMSSFVFKLNIRNVNDSIVGRPDKTTFPFTYTIENHPNNGPCFVGALYIRGGRNGDFRNQSCYCEGDTYNINLRNDNNKFSIDDYEVYQVIRE